MIYDRYEVVKEFTEMGYRIPMDVAVSLIADGLDISDLDRSFDGYDIYDLIEEKELYGN